MEKTERAALLSSWSGPSSDSEKDRQERAERMIKDAIDSWSAFEAVDYQIYSKGSYPNKTNVRSDSDVDVVIESRECFYFDYISGVTGNPALHDVYEGPWTPDRWRAEIVLALEGAFGEGSIDSTGNVAINVAQVEGSRPSADVVPSFNYYRYHDSERQHAYNGSCVFAKDGNKIVNWPDQQLENGHTKNTSTGYRYKQYVRVLKRVENELTGKGEIDEVPSYFMECLIYNVGDDVLKSGDFDEGFKSTLVALWQALDGGSCDEWVEPNQLKWLFKGVQKWAPGDAKTLVLAAWRYLGYGD